jgi:hypothetical protein
MMKRLRRKQAEANAEKNNPRIGAAPAIHMPDFDFLNERTKLKKLSQKMQREFEEDHRREERASMKNEDAQEEGEEEDGDEEDFGEEEEVDEIGMDEEDIEGVEEDEMDEEEIDEEGVDGDIECEEEDEGDEEELEIGENDGEIIEKTASEDDSDLVGSSFYEESESEEYQPSSGFLQASSILNRDTFKRKVTKDQIKLVKAEQRDDHKKLKLGAKIKQRGRLTNRQKQKNNPYQMFIQKKKLQNRLKDLKKEQKTKKNSKNFKGHQRSNRLGKSGAKKF